MTEQEYQIDWDSEIPLDGGRGEFVTLPMLVAEAYEARGVSAWCHATTRSPAFITHAMRCREDTFDAYGDGIPMCIYNVSGDAYDRVLVVYETPELPAGHQSSLNRFNFKTYKKTYI